MPERDPVTGSVAVNELMREVTIPASSPDAASPARRILFLGNSITLHPPKPEIGWTSDWGMAASALEKDFVNILLRRFAEAADGAALEARIENIATFEREYATFDVATGLAASITFSADTVILAIGENVPELATDQDQARFRSAVAALLDHVARAGAKTINVRGTFWTDPVKDATMQQACADAGGTFVDISRLGNDETNYGRSEREFAHDGVAAHPGDTGMASIAEAIWSAVQASSTQRR